MQLGCSVLLRFVNVAVAEQRPEVGVGWLPLAVVVQQIRLSLAESLFHFGVRKEVRARVLARPPSIHPTPPTTTSDAPPKGYQSVRGASLLDPPLAGIGDVA
ncbi:unnamed protein product [Arctogadus glacialis]